MGPTSITRAASAQVVHAVFEQVRDSGRARLFRSHNPDYADGGQLRDFVWVGDCSDIMIWLWRSHFEGGLVNIGTGQARSFLDLAQATFAAMGKPAAIDFVDTRVAIRKKYQYFTEARMERLRSAGYAKPFTSLEERGRQLRARLPRYRQSLLRSFGHIPGGTAVSLVKVKSSEGICTITMTRADKRNALNQELWRPAVGRLPEFRGR